MPGLGKSCRSRLAAEAAVPATTVAALSALELAGRTLLLGSRLVDREIAAVDPKPLNFSITGWASSVVAMAMNANPRERPVNLAKFRSTLATVPAWLNRSWRSCAVEAKGRLPTYSVMLIGVCRTRLGLIFCSFPTGEFRITTEPAFISPSTKQTTRTTSARQA